MKVTTNEALIEQRSKWAKRLAPLTMLFLIGGLITNFMSVKNPDLFRPTLILLALGFVSAIFRSHLVNSWVKEPRGDQVLSQVLKKFGNDYLLFNYTSPVPHVLLAPDGLYIVVVKNHGDQITVDGRKFKRKFTASRLLRMFADEGLGSPVGEGEGKMSKLNKYLRAQMPEETIPEIKPLILFTNKKVQLTINNPAVPVLTTNKLKTFFRDEGKNRTISAEQRRILAPLLGGNLAATE